MMLGRDLELDATCNVVDRARGGRSSSIAICGEAGIGKTTLLDAVRARTAPFVHVLATQGRAADAEIGYSSLLTLLRPVEQHLDELAGAHADAVRAAMMMDQTAVDPIAVQVGVFRVISSLAEHHSVLLVIDDAHLLDAATAAALCFAVGRLDADPVATVIAVDPSGPGVWSDMAIHTLTLGPIDNDVLAAIVRDDLPIDERVLEHCCKLASGNPLAALEIARSMTVAERSGDVPPPLVPRLQSGVAHGFVTRLEIAGPAVQRVMAVVAADDTGDIEVVRRGLTILGESLDGLFDAERAELIIVDGGMVRLAHPLLRAVAYHQVAAPSRRAAHLALASALTEQHHGAAKAWQLVAAADGPDDGAAEALDLVALDALRRGGPASAARISERAALLSSSAHDRSTRLAAATLAWFAAGEIDRCRACLDQLADLPATAETLVAIGTAAIWTDGPRRAQHRINHVAGRVDSSLIAMARVLSIDVSVAAGFVDGIAELAVGLLDDREVGPLAADVLARLPDAPPRRSDRITVGPLAYLAGLRRRRASVEAGRLAEVASDMAELSPLAGLVLPSGVDDQLTKIAAQRHGGELNQALASSGVAIELMPESAHLPRAAVSLALADLECLLGRREDAMRHLDAAVPVLAEYGCAEHLAFAGWIHGRLAREAGQMLDALDALERAARARPHLYAAEFATTVALCGDTDDQRRRRIAGCSAVDELLVGDVDRPLVEVRRLRAAAALDDDVELFEQSAHLAAAHGLWIEEAETWLIASEWAQLHERFDIALHATERSLEIFGRSGARFGQHRVVSQPTGRNVDELLSPAESRSGAGGGQRDDEQGGRNVVVRERQDHRLPSAGHLPQARHPLAHRTRYPDEPSFVDRERSMSDDAGRRERRWWEALSPDHDADGDTHSPTSDPWVEIEGKWDLTLSAAQRAFLIGDIDQPPPPRIRTIDVEYEPVGSGTAATASVPGDNTGNATGNAPSDPDDDDLYGRLP